MNKLILKLEKNNSSEVTKLTGILFECHSIVKNSKGLSPEAAFNEVVKVLLIKIMYERLMSSEEIIFSQITFNEEKRKYIESNRGLDKKVIEPYIQNLLKKTDSFFENGTLFYGEEIRVEEEIFIKVLEKLSKYNFSEINSDINGIAFENFLEEIFKRELGSFFTPLPIVDFMVDIIDPCEGEIICDPCAGTGGFLISSYKKIKKKIIADIPSQRADVFDNCEKSLAEDEKEDKELSLKRNISNKLDTLSKESLFGIDINYNAFRTSKLNMLIHGWKSSELYLNNGLVNINGIFEERFDIVLTSPPFNMNISSNLKISGFQSDDESIKNNIKKYGINYEKNLEYYKKNSGKLMLDFYETGKYTKKIDALFIERSLNLLKPGGRMGIILSNAILNTEKMDKVREICEGKAKLLLIVSIPSDVFISLGMNVKTSLVFLKKFTEKEKKNYNKAKLEVRREIENNHANLLLSKEKEILNKNLELEELMEKNKELKKTKSSEKIKKLTKDELFLKEKIKSLKEEKNEMAHQPEKAKEAKIRSKVREEFDYIIPFANIKDGGITTTGVKTENNELNQLVKEFKDYRLKNKMWENKVIKTSINGVK